MASEKVPGSIISFHISIIRWAVVEAWSAVDTVVTVVGVLIFIATWFNKELAHHLAVTWDGLSRWWAIAPVAIVLLYRIVRANYAHFEIVREGIKKASTELDNEKNKNQKPEFKGRIYEVFVEKAAHHEYQGRALVYKDDYDGSVVVLRVGIYNTRDIGTAVVGVSIRDYRLRLEVDGVVYEGVRIPPSPQLQTVILNIGAGSLAMDMEAENIGSVFYMHERGGSYAIFFVKGLQCEPALKQHCNVALTIFDLDGNSSQPIEAKDCPFVFGRIGFQS